ncbi:TetR/AcrR family transcriptional regulator [Vibrio sp.]|uniref:TetR/AcrR family transcriptional regulator n=1 Tax=Vibrio viridaestus TaxID=2487322 RepID=A0A3N9TJN3_9VIBR|nr:TetR/AcrR family transcriptional regulator [Vibrio viridaestus]MDC0609718.1 TetR/AcrR family transcriptional regulator [Vibrio sp.]RQW64588.1 TetR/AcrR family transcriptional regulator [Vibrio viridaestus]
MARTVSFDRNEKLEQAMNLFWEKGYANTSIADLVSSLGINRFSLYNTFRDKKHLYAEALDHYFSKISLPNLSLLDNENGGLNELEKFLLLFAERQRLNCHGCLIQNAIIEHAGHDVHVLDKGEQLFNAIYSRLEHLVKNGQRAGEITSAVSSDALTRLILVQMQGMRVMSKAKRYQDIESSVTSILTIIKAL